MSNPTLPTPKLAADLLPHQIVYLVSEVHAELDRQSNNAAILAQQVADLTAELAKERAHQFRALHEPDTCNGSMGASGYVPACVAMRASFAAIHARVCHAPVSDGMCAAIADECEHAVPELAALRGNP